MSFCMLYDSATNWAEVTATRSPRKAEAEDSAFLTQSHYSLPTLSLSVIFPIASSPCLGLHLCHSSSASLSTHLSIPHPCFHWSSSPPCSPSSSFLTFFSPFLQLLLPSLAWLHFLSHLFSSFHFISKRLPVGARPSRNPKPKSLYLCLSPSQTNTQRHTQTHTCSYVYTHWSFTTARLFHSVVTWEESTNM